MSHDDLETLALALVADGKGILAADETSPTLTKRFVALGIESTAQSRRTYREMLFTSPGVAEFISGVIMYDETIRQKSSAGMPLPQVLSNQGIIPGIKVDTGAKPLAACPGESVTEGLDGLRDRLAEYREMGARFAKWRAVIRIADSLPSSTLRERECTRPRAIRCALSGNGPRADRRAGSADGRARTRSSGAKRSRAWSSMRCSTPSSSSASRCESMLLKPNMVIAGEECSRQASVQEVATATLRCLRRHVPAAVPGIVFLSGGQSDRMATAHLNAINRLPGAKPWKIGFSYGRALQDPALAAWRGSDENLKAGQEALYHRAKCNAAASRGAYSDEMEPASARCACAVRRGEDDDEG